MKTDLNFTGLPKKLSPEKSFYHEQLVKYYGYKKSEKILKDLIIDGIDDLTYNKIQKYKPRLIKEFNRFDKKSYTVNLKIWTK